MLLARVADIFALRLFGLSQAAVFSANRAAGYLKTPRCRNLAVPVFR